MERCNETVQRQSRRYISKPALRFTISILDTVEIVCFQQPCNVCVTAHVKGVNPSGLRAWKGR
jgi:hypothetical protein